MVFQKIQNTILSKDSINKFLELRSLKTRSSKKSISGLNVVGNLKLNLLTRSAKNEKISHSFPFFCTKKNKPNRGYLVYTSPEGSGKGTKKEKQRDRLITYEEIGLFPRSFSRVLDRFIKQLFFDVENLVINEYRFYRYLFLTAIKCFVILLFFPFLVNFFAKNYLIRPLTEYCWNQKQNEIFLNSYQQENAFLELQDFEEKIYFESLILPQNVLSSPSFFLPKKEGVAKKSLSASSDLIAQSAARSAAFFFVPKKIRKSISLTYTSKDQKKKHFLVETRTNNKCEPHCLNQKKILLQTKTMELAIENNNKSIEAITNFFADLVSLLTIWYLIFILEVQLSVTKSFILEVFFGLDDGKKSLVILLITDLLVGYHSPACWTLFFQSCFTYYGFPESKSGIMLLVATLPVVLDVLFKYLIFRHLNRSSPATVATYHAMIE